MYMYMYIYICLYIYIYVYIHQSVVPPVLSPFRSLRRLYMYACICTYSQWKNNYHPDDERWNGVIHSFIPVYKYIYMYMYI